MKKYRIADIVIELECREELIHQNFNSFEWNGPEDAQFHWVLKDYDFPIVPDTINWIELPGFSVGRYNDKVYVSYPLENMYKLRWILYEDNFSKATFYYNKGPLDELPKEQKEELTRYLFAFYQEAFFLGSLYMDGISIHSASLIYKEKGLAFSAMSQTGKSTHTNLWKEKYDTPILDGDVTICRCMEEGDYIYGLPWCGTSNLFLNQKVELEAIVFLKQGPKNIVSNLNAYDQFQHLFSRSFTPVWYKELAKQRISVTEKIIQRIPQIYLLECLPDLGAVESVKSVIDEKWK